MLVTTQTSSEVSDMLNLYYTEKMLGLQEVKVKNISIWFILAIIPFLFSVGLYTVEQQYGFLIILSIVFL